MKTLKNHLFDTVVALCLVGALVGTFLTFASGQPASATYAKTPYMATSDAKPVTWSPCAPVHYEVNLHDALPGTLSALSRDVALIESATGLRFVFDGTTNATLNSQWTTYSNNGHYHPVLVAFASPKTSTLLSSALGDLGDGSASWVDSPSGYRHFVSGSIIVNTAAGLRPGFGSGLHLGNLLLHELGHVVGLAHSHDPQSFMYPYLGVMRQVITPADAAHLAALGRGHC